MAISFQSLFEILEQTKKEQANDFNDTLDTVKQSQIDPCVIELMQFLSKKEEPYITYSHV